MVQEWIDPDEPLRRVAAEYGLSRETIRRHIRAAKM
jgi:transposase-like protein